MTTQPPSRPRPASGGTGLMLTISAATIVTVALEAVFVALASWALLPAILLVILGMTGIVIRAVGRVLEDGTVASPRIPSPSLPAQQAATETGTRRVPSRPALGH